DPAHPLLVAHYATGFVRSHTVSVDTTRALLVCNGTRDAALHEAGMRILSLAVPDAPVELSHWPADDDLAVREDYIHDSVFQGTRLYGSCIFGDRVIAFDLADPRHPVAIASWTWPGAH